MTGKVNTSIAGTYELIYEVADAAGNKANATRTVTVEEEKTGSEEGPGTNKPGTDSSNGSGNNGSNTSGSNGTNGSGSNKTDGTNDGKTQTVRTGDTSNATIPVITAFVSFLVGCGVMLKMWKEKRFRK